MNTSTAKMALALVLCIGFPGIVAAQQSGWNMPNLNPFAARSSAPTSTRVADSGSGGWKMPSMWPNGNKSAQKPAGPSTWQKMRTSTRRAWNQTVDFLNPFDDASDKTSTTPITGSNTYFSQNARRSSGGSASNDKTSFFPTLWSSEEPDDGPKNVTDFLKQPRVQP